MRKYILLFLLCLVSAYSHSQELRCGVTAGLLISQPKGYNSRIGFDVGVKGEYLFTEKNNDWAMNVALMLTSKGWKDNVAYISDERDSWHDWVCKYYSLELPVMAKYIYHLSDNIGVFLEAGPYIAYGLWGNSKIENLPESSPEYDIDNIYKSGKYKRLDYGFKTCLGVTVSQWQLGIGWSKSLHKPTDQWKAINPKDNTYAVQLTYMF